VEAERLPLTKDDFRRALDQRLRDSERAGKSFVEIEAGALHRELGDYPGLDHRMPVCCAAMEEAMRAGDRRRPAPPKGRGASLRVRYALPR
jgi:hypothetical protein